jgi:hypothetical protein
MANSFSPNYLNNVFQQSVVQGPTGPTGAIDLVDLRNITIANGNLTVNGDGNETGSLLAQYITLPDLTDKQQETYLYADNNTLLWDTGVVGFPAVSTDVIGWVPKLRQDVSVTLLPDDATTSDIVTAYNSLITTLYQKGVIFSAPVLPIQTQGTFDAFAIGTDTPYNGDPTRNQKLKVFTMAATNWPVELVNINQIQSVVVNFYSGISRDSSFSSDARFGFSDDDSKLVYYSYQRRINRINPDINAVGSSDISAPPNTTTLLTQNDITITDKATLSRLFATPSNPNMVDKVDINAYWTCGYAGNLITNCKLNKLIFNYSY